MAMKTVGKQTEDDSRTMSYQGLTVEGPAVDLVLMPRRSMKAFNGSLVRRISRRYWRVNGLEVKISRAIELIWQ